MSPTKISAEISGQSAIVGPVARPRVITAADVNEVMREQLEFLIEHAEGGDCGCQRCNRYGAVRILLLELFAEKSKPRKRLLTFGSSQDGISF